MMVLNITSQFPKDGQSLKIAGVELGDLDRLSKLLPGSVSWPKVINLSVFNSVEEVSKSQLAVQIDQISIEALGFCVVYTIEGTVDTDEGIARAVEVTLVMRSGAIVSPDGTENEVAFVTRFAFSA